MTQSNKQIQRLAHKLVATSLEDGAPSSERVEAVLAMLRRQPEAQRRKLLQAYLRLMRREEAKSQLRIEHAGPLSDDAREAIVQKMSEQSGRRLRVETRENPALIGGVRVRLADDIYDTSVLGRLATLGNVQ